MREDEVLGVSRVRGRDHEDVCSEKGRGVSLLRNHGIVLVERYGDRGPAHEKGESLECVCMYMM